MLLAGIGGYSLSQRFGMGMLRWICRDEKKLEESVSLFAKRGPILLLLCRASPILPEVSSCLAGATKMKFIRFLLFFGLATIPYAFAAARAGSISSLDDPSPAIFTAVGISLMLWLIWWRMAARWKSEAKIQSNE
ncbi:VTT domain-containing protein [Puniceicoccaceae bacterium K14]|nr:VTT domain-containing protein [Puniceicoccaceae bacterium K14]